MKKKDDIAIYILQARVVCNAERFAQFFSNLTSEQKTCLNSTCFAPLLSMPRVPMCSNLIFLLIEKFNPKNGYFSFGIKNISISEGEVALILALGGLHSSDGIGSLSEEDALCVQLFWNKYFDMRTEITLDSFENVLNTILQNGNSVEFKRIFLLYIVITFLLPKDTLKISKELLSMVWCDEIFNRIPWGRLVHNHLLKSLHICATKFKETGKHVHFVGCALVLQVIKEKFELLI